MCAGARQRRADHSSRKLSEWQVKEAANSLDLQILASFHMLFAAVFVGSNVFLDFLLTPRLDLIPPGQAARLGDKLGTDFAWLNWVALMGPPLSGLLMRWRLCTFSSSPETGFYIADYGAGIATIIAIWISFISNGAN